MAKKRKSLATSLDEVDRSMYSTFSSTANSLTQLYTQAMNQQKLSFQAGERHGLNELDCSGEEPSMSPRAPAQHQHLQSTQFANTNFLVSSGSSGVLPSAQAFRPEPCDSQPRNYVFSNALSSPVRRSLQNYHISPGSYFQNNVQPITNANRGETNFIHQQGRDPNPGNSNDSSMDMHAD